EVMFDAEHFFDGYKDDPEYAMECVGAALDGGAVTAVLCDTNGGSLPSEVFESVSAASRRFGAILGIHTHDDSGMAAANTVEAVRAGAVQVQGTINGYGERCGNANLCTVIPALVMKAGVDCLCAASLPRLREMSEFVADLLNLRPDSKAPFVGGSAFSHKGGPHVDAVRKNPRTFEHVTPESVGNSRRMLMSDLAGSSGVLLKAVEVGAGGLASKKDAREVLGALKEMERKGYAFEAADASFRILIQKVLREHRSFFDLEGFRVIIEKRGKDVPCVSEATIRVRVRGESEHTAAEGDGPVNALDRALRKALLRFYPEIAKVFLTDFRVRILDPQEATAAKTRVLIESSDGEERWGTVGVSGNIIEASWEALVDSVEYKLFREEEKARAIDGKKLRPKGR
ncbi:MAG: citramalate synthase, partial [Lentisphaerae bacterium]|nr:citramalate synthase [Lentisphaerota bacterium]